MEESEGDTIITKDIARHFPGIGEFISIDKETYVQVASLTVRQVIAILSEGKNSETFFDQDVSDMVYDKTLCCFGTQNDFDFEDPLAVFDKRFSEAHWENLVYLAEYCRMFYVLKEYWPVFSPEKSSKENG